MMRYVSFVLIFVLFAFHACEDNKNEDKFFIEFKIQMVPNFQLIIFLPSHMVNNEFDAVL